MELGSGDVTKKKKNCIVKINIGGYRYETTEATLNSGKPNFFTYLLGDSIPSTIDEKGFYFVDRDGKYFSVILEYLRTGDVIYPPDLSIDV